MTSPRPWKRNDNTINAADGSLVAVLGTTVGDAPWAVRARHDGDLIVQAVNERDAMLSQLKETAEWLMDISAHYGKPKTSYVDPGLAADAANLRKQIDAFLTQVEAVSA